MAPKKITLDGDKGLWTLEEVEALLKEAGLNVEVTKPDGDTHDTEVELEEEPGANDTAGDGLTEPTGDVE